jgi:hypothetical protein
MRFVSLALAIALESALSACPEGASEKISESCHKAYDKCLQRNGVLGICDVVECGQGATPPCLICRSQH